MAFAFVKLAFIYLCAHVQQGLCLEVRGQLTEVTFLLPSYRLQAWWQESSLTEPAH